ncbi:unnamed protein product [Ambrosiozyma monospora]|uniref:Unnamed protein product n=1 Tax=Ambrosiozyma monospora TaxID=43982 RepID=A0ACB5TVH2_AMBMO|nr:unnamed protein product [Ambrosiozyma monospora]
MNLMNGNNPMFSSSQINRARQLKNKRLNWQELGISEFTSSKKGGKHKGNGGPGHGQRRRDHVPDLTILKRPIFTNSNEFDGGEDGLLGASFDYSNQITTTGFEDDELLAGIAGDASNKQILNDPHSISSVDLADVAGSSSRHASNSQFVTPIVPNRVVYYSFGGDSTTRRSSTQNPHQRRVSTTSNNGGNVSSAGNHISGDYMTTPQNSHSRIIR